MHSAVIWDVFIDSNEFETVVGDAFQHAVKLSLIMQNTAQGGHAVAGFETESPISRSRTSTRRPSWHTCGPQGGFLPGHRQLRADSRFQPRAVPQLVSDLMDCEDEGVAGLVNDDLRTERLSGPGWLRPTGVVSLPPPLR
jgi:hypothetical protein